MEEPKMYLHKETGAVDDRLGWMQAYSVEELEERNLCPDEAFTEDLYNTLFEVKPDGYGG